MTPIGLRALMTDLPLTPLDADDWMQEAACKGLPADWFFPTNKRLPLEGEHATYSDKQAKNVCKKCPVQEQCLDYALSEDIDLGIWAGMGNRERKRQKAARR